MNYQDEDPDYINHINQEHLDHQKYLENEYEIADSIFRDEEKKWKEHHTGGYNHINTPSTKNTKEKKDDLRMRTIILLFLLFLIVCYIMYGVIVHFFGIIPIVLLMIFVIYKF